LVRFVKEAKEGLDASCCCPKDTILLEDFAVFPFVNIEVVGGIGWMAIIPHDTIMH
jgi:hypothetical protein